MGLGPSRRETVKDLLARAYAVQPLNLKVGSIKSNSTPMMMMMRVTCDTVQVATFNGRGERGEAEAISSVRKCGVLKSANSAGVSWYAQLNTEQEPQLKGICLSRLAAQTPSLLNFLSSPL